MKKQLLLASLAGIFMSAVAGEGAKQVNRQLKPISTPVKVVNAPQFRPLSVQSSGSRSDRALSKVTVGSSGNLYGVVRSTSNCIDADDSINAVSFTYRTDESVYPLSNSSRYRFSKSADGGATWSLPSKELNRTNVYANTGINGRYPQGLIYRAPGVTEADSAYLVYSGTWHNGAAGVWSGESRGVGQLSADSTTFTESNDVVDNARVLIGSSLAKANGGKFFNLNEEMETSGTYTGPTTGIVLSKGSWNATTKDVDWTDEVFPVDFESFSTGTSAFTSQAIAFDPSGQKGYLVGVGDINPGDGKYELKPFYYVTTDGGANWTGPTAIDVDNIAGFQKPEIVDPGTGDTTHTTLRVTGTIDLVVDFMGNAHIGLIVHLAPIEDAEYSSYFPAYGYNLFDLTLGGNLCQTGWVANYLKTIHATFSQFEIIGEGTSDFQTDNNRLQASRSADGKFVFFLWAETDSAVAADQQAQDAPDNISPDLLGVGIDVENKKTTLVKNFTAGDALFGGQTGSSPAGTAGGATFLLVSPSALKTTGGFKVPATLTEADYHNPTASPKEGLNPSRHWYCQNVDFSNAEFTEEGGDLEPPVFAGVPDTLFVHLDSTFTTPSVTAYDCNDGDVTSEITSTSDVQTDSIGIYTLTYTVTDSAGNTATVSVPVYVQAEPIALIAYTRVLSNRYQFRDSSLNLPTYRQWTFSNGSAASTAEVLTKTFSNPGTVNVCLYVSNTFGNDQVCQDFEVTLPTGIENIELANSISVYPTTSNGQITVAVNKEMANDLTISVYNVAGAKVSPDYVAKRNASSTNISLNVASGLYQLRIGNEKDGYTVKPIVVQK